MFEPSAFQPDLVRKYRYPLEEHTVITPDGYILGMHRIPHGRDNNNEPKDKPIIFLMHGLLGSSSDFVLMGPGSGLAYILAEEGFDVWMGNARGNYYSRRHEWLRPDALLNTDFWDFSWDEIGHIDLPSMIDYTLEYTGKQQLHYIGFSQGTTSFFVMGSLRPEYNDKIISMHALAPVAYMAHNRNLLFNALAPFSRNIADLAESIGIGEFLPNRQVFTWAGQTFCKDEAIFQPVCSSILFLISGWNVDQLNTIAHYGQGISEKRFRRYDFGWTKNRRIYGSFSPPNYNLGNVRAPVFLHYSQSDPLAHVTDVERLFNELGNPVGKFSIAQRTFGHLDFLYGINATTLVNATISKMLSALLVLFCVAVTHAGRSPNADYVEELIRNNKFGRISDSVPDLAAKYRYPLEEHTVVTPDGYILQMHRIPYGRDNNNEPGDKPVVFVMHGLWGSSADFILMGPGSGLDYTLEYTGKQQLHYIGFSQGTTSFFVMGSLRPEYNDKIISMHALAPIAYMAHVPNLLLRALAPFATQIADVANLLGIGEFLSHSPFYTWAGQSLCSDEAVFQPVCSNILFLISGYSPDQLNTTMLPVILGHFPAGSSIRQATHYLQGISQKGFRRYNFGLLRNQKIYGSISPPDYNLGNITAPVFLYYSEGDALSRVLDVERLYNELPFAEKFLNADSNYGHIDYAYGINATSLVYDYVINTITSLENQNK
ncbi:unnamed protein product [Leptidea sinapis]|uniref:Partial AB-hydrolase lipase domain-containing protein n=1 Tax=Leptidea sinapis TaxID=189913 RepID=A0A5E4QEP1_9NEOP|nr:unnamed protein product [Leptidea sinapis]